MLGLLWAILASMACTMVVGMLWYGPLFGKIWLKGMGWDNKTDDELKAMQKTAGPGYALAQATTALAVFLLWIMFGWADGAPDGYSNWMKGMSLSLAGFIAFYIPGTLTGSFFHEQKISVWALGAGYWLVLAALWGTFVGIFH